MTTFVPDYEPDEITAVIRRTTSVSPLEGPRGSEFTLEGKGYAQGTVTVFDGDDMVIHPGETLASVKTSRGSFTAKLKVRGELGDPRYKVWTRDSNGAIHFAEFEIRSSMVFQPATVSIGGMLKIVISDWADRHQEVAAVQIGGVDAYTATPIEHGQCFGYEGLYFADNTGMVSFEVKVPEGVPPGEQTVAVYGHEGLEHYDANDGLITGIQPCADVMLSNGRGNATSRKVTAKVKAEPFALVEKTVEVEAQALTLSPGGAVRGQRVTISGSGFAAGGSEGDIVEVSINGSPVPENPEQFEVSHNGDVAVTVSVPMDARTGENEVRVEGWDGTLGTGTLTVPEPAIALDPPAGQRGTQATVTGSGFVATGFFRLAYGDGGDLDTGDEYVGLGQTDAKGNFELLIRVPLTAGIGRSHVVTAVMEIESGAGPTIYNAVADHLPPTGTIATSPEWVSPGDLMTIRGENLPPYALVRPVEFAGRDITPVPNISTSRAGSFGIEIKVPPMELGDQTLRVEVSGVVVTHIVEVTSPPLSGPPASVFRELIQAGVLLRVWYLERSTQEWFFFDPDPALAEFSGLTDVKRREFYWMHLSASHEFLGDLLHAGWNLIPLK